MFFSWVLVIIVIMVIKVIKMITIGYILISYYSQFYNYLV